MKRINSIRYSILTAMLLVFSPAMQANANPLEGMPSGGYELDLSHASVIWKVSHLGFSTYVGRFNRFSTDLQLNSDDFSKSSVSVDIEVDSLDTDFPFPEEENFNKKLSTEWFKSEEHPSITFTSKEVSGLSEDNRFTIKGDLTLMGNTHPVTLEAKLNKAATKHPFKEAAAVGFSAHTVIDRTVWGLSKYAPNIGAEVKIEIEGEFTQATE